ncbi:11909_t:CDS:2, partial [Racocetra persica]
LTHTQNLLKSGFQCTCSEVKSGVESNPSAAISKYYQQIFITKTEYFGLATMSFENELIIQQLIADIVFFLIFLHIDKFIIVVSSIGDPDENKLYDIGAGFVSLFMTRYHKALYLFVLKIEEHEYVLKIYSESVCVGKITGADPDKVWNQVEVLKKYTRLYLFEITNTLVQQHINILKNESLTCAVKEWSNTMQLEKVFNLQNSLSVKNSPNKVWWDSFRDVLLLNKKGSDSIIRILSVIALNFKYRILKEELGARKHARLYGPGTSTLQKPKRTAQRLTDVQEEQFLLFFQDKENVSMSSYHVDSKTRLPILYLCNQKKGLWEKFNETYPN